MVRVEDVFVAVNKAKDGQPSMILRTDGGQDLIIPIGGKDSAILHILLEEYNEISRLPTTMLTSEVLSKFQIEVTSVEVSMKELVKDPENPGEESEIFITTITLFQNGKNIKFNCRPTDAVSLAIPQGAPIFIDEKLLEKEIIPDKAEPPAIMKELEEGKPEFTTNTNTDDFQQFLKKIKPEDFKKH